MPFAPLTVTVAVYVPTESPVSGRTVKLLSPPTAMLLNDVPDKVNSFASAPESATVNAPVAWLPVLVTVTECAAGRVPPTVIEWKVYVPV